MRASISATDDKNNDISSKISLGQKNTDYNFIGTLKQKSLKENIESDAIGKNILKKDSLAKEEKAANPVLEGNRWYVRGNNVNGYIKITPKAISQAVVIEDCSNCTIEIESKVAAVIVDNCKRMGIKVNGVLSNVEVISSNSVVLSLDGTVPTVVLDGCEGIQIQLDSAEGRSVSILTSKCSEVNVVASKAILSASPLASKENGNEEDEDLVELAIPMQFRSFIDAKSGTLITEPVHHVGA
jgi:adenylyl cyclase-associated protein